MHGTTVCATHGGKASQVMKAAKRRLSEAKAEDEMRTLGARRDIMPGEALLEEVQWTAGHVAWLRERVQEVDQQALVFGRTKTVEDDAGLVVTMEAKASVWYTLYERERQHLITATSAALKAGVEERRVRLAEAQGAQVAAVIQRVLDALELTAAQRKMVPTIVPAALRAITA